AQTKFAPGYDFINGNDLAVDDNGHGTHIAGTIAQSTNNGLGTAGIAYDATVLPVKVADRDGGGTVETLADGIRFAADHGARVLNVSIGLGTPAAVLQDAL